MTTQNFLNTQLSSEIFMARGKIKSGGTRSVFFYPTPATETTFVESSKIPQRKITALFISIAPTHHKANKAQSIVPCVIINSLSINAGDCGNPIFLCSDGDNC